MFFAELSRDRFGRDFALHVFGLAVYKKTLAQHAANGYKKNMLRKSFLLKIILKSWPDRPKSWPWPDFPETSKKNFGPAQRPAEIV